ncbi:hypothetical protein MGWOODY_Smn2846 [hydrothermal vent metagenome]|uniref:Uncharacterized protein n=1 Tax=hydrothermal vent metagenome TaxID=652676 RepID=A0A160TLE3_9ZZZZ
MPVAVEQAEIAARTDDVAEYLAGIVAALWRDADIAGADLGRRDGGVARRRVIGVDLVEEARRQIGVDQPAIGGGRRDLDGDAGGRRLLVIALALVAAVRELAVDLDGWREFVADPAERALAIFRREQRGAADMALAPDQIVAADHPLAVGRAEHEIIGGRLAGRRIDLAEIDAPERPGADQAAFSELAGADAALDQARGVADRRWIRVGTGGRAIGRVVDLEETGVVPVAIDRMDALLGEIFAADQDMALAAGEGRAARQRELVVRAIAIGGDAIFVAALDAGIFFVENEVDHARHGVRAIGRGRAAGHYFDPFDQRLREGVDVDHAAGGGRDRALAVEQYQGALRAEVAQVDRGDAGKAVAERAVRIGRGRAAAHRRKRVDEIGDIGGRLGLQFLAADHADRGGGVIAVAHDARSGDGDLVLGRLASGGLIIGGRIDRDCVAGGCRCLVLDARHHHRRRLRAGDTRHRGRDQGQDPGGRQAAPLEQLAVYNRTCAK